MAPVYPVHLASPNAAHMAFRAMDTCAPRTA